MSIIKKCQPEVPLLSIKSKCYDLDRVAPTPLCLGLDYIPVTIAVQEGTNIQSGLDWFIY